MSSPLIISVATAGALATKRDNPAVPYSAADIAAEIVAAARAGAAHAHVHTRGPAGETTQDLSDYREIVDRVGEHSDIIVELSLGSRGFTLEEALEPLALRPVMASFPMVARQEAAQGRGALEDVARRMLDHGVRPAYAITSRETKATVCDLIDRGLAGEVPCVVVGPDPDGSPPQVAARLAELTADLGAEWWLVKSGKTPAVQYAMRALAIASGGHVRVGFEDAVRTYDDRGLAGSNAYFVEQMAELAAAMGRPLATAAQARRQLKLQEQDRARQAG